jgi:hypothetical protein
VLCWRANRVTRLSTSSENSISVVPPPPRPRPKRYSSKAIAIIAVSAIVLGIAGIFAVRAVVVASGITKGPDTLFGDQWLKTSVALIELHKVRYGKYPDSLADLKFVGEWDRGAILRVRYYPNAARNAYYIEVETGWMGKPTLTMPDEFWRGTGYDPRLKPKD